MADITYTFSEEEVAPEPSYDFNPTIWIGFGPRQDGTVESEGNDRRVLKGEAVVGQVSGFATEHKDGIVFEWAKTQRDKDGNLKYPDGRVAYLKLRDQAGNDQFITLSLANLLGKVRKLVPFAVGDKMKVTYEGDRKTDLGTMKLFDIRIKRMNATAEEREGWLQSTNVKPEAPEPMTEEQVAVKAARDAVAPF